MKMKYLKIPIERIGVLIGKNGENKEKIEKNTKAKIIIDSNNYKPSPLLLISPFLLFFTYCL